MPTPFDPAKPARETGDLTRLIGEPSCPSAAYLLEAVAGDHADDYDMDAALSDWLNRMDEALAPLGYGVCGDMVLCNAFGSPAPVDGIRLMWREGLLPDPTDSLAAHDLTAGA